MSTKKTKSTPANIPRSRCNRTRRQRKGDGLTLVQLIECVNYALKRTRPLFPSLFGPRKNTA